MGGGMGESGKWGRDGREWEVGEGWESVGSGRRDGRERLRERKGGRESGRRWFGYRRGDRFGEAEGKKVRERERGDRIGEAEGKKEGMDEGTGEALTSIHSSGRISAAIV